MKIPDYYIVIYSNPSNVVSLFVFFSLYNKRETNYFNKLLSKLLLLPLSHPSLVSEHIDCILMHRLAFKNNNNKKPTNWSILSVALKYIIYREDLKTMDKDTIFHVKQFLLFEKIRKYLYIYTVLIYSVLWFFFRFLIPPLQVLK